jgi:hypothetical protein
MVDDALTLPPRPRAILRYGSYFGPRFWMAAIVAASALWVGLSTAPERAILLPALVMVDAGAIFLLVLYRRDRRLPVFEIGSLWVLIALLYSVFPLLNYYVAGLRWTIVSDGRLWAYDAGPEETGHFAWFYVCYMIPFVVTYLFVRKRARVVRTSITRVTRSRVTAVVLGYIGCGLVLAAVARVYGITYDPSYQDAAAGKVETLTALPYLLQQAVHYLLPIRLLLVQIMLFIGMQRWRNWKYRVAIVLFLAFEAGRTIYVGGARTELVLLGITFVLLYHRLVRPLTIKVALPAATILLMAFNFLGLVREPGYMEAMRIYNVPRLAAANEFQVVWGTSFDIYNRQQLGTLPAIPRQLPFSDFYYMVPSQLLPFEKIDLQGWYFAVSGYTGVMFGAIAQGLIGFGWKQLIIQGILLGYLCAKLHRWYAKRAERFWPTIFYLFCCTWTYYSMRQSSLAVLSFIEYEFVPVLVTVELLSVLLRGAHQRARVLIKV